MNPWGKYHFSGKVFFSSFFLVFLVAPILKTCSGLKRTRPSIKLGRRPSKSRYTSKRRPIEKKALLVLVLDILILLIKGSYDQECEWSCCEQVSGRRPVGRHGQLYALLENRTNRDLYTLICIVGLRGYPLKQ